MKERELNEGLMFAGYYSDVKATPRLPDIDVIISKAKNDTDIIGITLTIEQARIVSFSITNSWPEFTEDEKITAQKLLTRVNKIYEAD